MLVMSAHLAVIGAGQLGSRHLESLARLSRPARIWVWDPSPGALARARRRWEEAGRGPGLAADFTGRFPGRLDAAIVATDAASRERAVEELPKGREIRFMVLEKLLFQEPEALPRVGDLLKRGGVRAWVNCPRRIWPLYSRLRPGLPLSFRVSGSGWGLATNAVHYLDLAAYLTGFLDFSVETGGLSRAEVPSKRPGFVEFHGTLAARAGGHQVLLPCEPGARSCRVEINGGVVEKAGAPVQSRLTEGVVEELRARGDCGLTSYEDSARIHRPLLGALRDHWRAIKGGRDAFCLVT
jgi:predicted dehydrogenase